MVFLTGISFILNLTALLFPVCQRVSFTPSYVTLLDDIALILQKNGGGFIRFLFFLSCALEQNFRPVCGHAHIFFMSSFLS